MMKYIIYDSSGEILRTGSCAWYHWDNLASEGEFRMEGEADPRYQRVIHDEENPQIVDKDPEPDETNESKIEYVSDYLRGERALRLKATDWTQMPDSPLSTDKKTEFSTYRQALRDLPASHTTTLDVDDIVWPTEPSL